MYVQRTLHLSSVKRIHSFIRHHNINNSTKDQDNKVKITANKENVSSINNNAGVFHRIVCSQIRKTREYYYAFNGTNSRLKLIHNTSTFR